MTKFTGKHLCQSLFFSKVAGLRSATLLKKETLEQVFSCEFCQISKNTFFTEHLWTTASTFCFQEINDDCSELQEELSTVDFQKYEDILLEYDNILEVDGSLRELDLLYAKADRFHTMLEHLKHSLSKTTLICNREKSECEFVLSGLSEKVKSFDEITKKYKTSLEEHSKAIAILHSVKKVSWWMYFG